MRMLPLSCVCFALFVTAFVRLECYGQGEQSGNEPATSTTSQLVAIAKARLEQHELRLEAIRALGKLKRDIHEVQLVQAKTQRESVMAEMNAAEVLNEQQRNELARIRKLVEQAVVTPSKLTEVESQVAMAVARLAHARNNLKRAEVSIQAASLQLEQSKWESALDEAEATIELLDAKAELVRLQSESLR